MTIRSDTIEDGLLDPSHRFDPSQQAHTLIHRIYNSIKPRRAPQPRSYPPPLSSIPPTSPERLALAFPGSPDDASSAPTTVLYLAYGSNLSAETFLGMRRIRPLSKINVSVPTFDLAFDLPALAYWEPCFANVSPRKIPTPPIPGHPPRPPFPPPSPPTSARSDRQDELAEEEEKLPGTLLLPSLPPDHNPSWSKGLYGVVYEVTREDYTRIVHTEGTAYEEILTPCLALPPPFHVPEKPPIPELPRPFLARTLYAPQLPSFDPPDGDGDDGGDDKKRWWQKLLLPVQRTPGYAQPSPRYLRLIRDGAREHYLPDDYQTYLARLESYTITTWRQDIGRWLFLFTVVPSFALLALLGYLLASKDGGIPKWLEAATTIQRNLMWKVYDYVFKPLFGDGERTIQEEDDSGSTSRIRTQTWGSEKNRLLADW